MGKGNKMTLDEFIAYLQNLRVKNKLNYDIAITIATDDFGILPVKSVKVQTVLPVLNKIDGDVRYYDEVNQYLDSYKTPNPKFNDAQKVIVLDID